MNQYNPDVPGPYYLSAPYEITRHELRAAAVTHMQITLKVIEDFCNSSERLEQIGAMIPTTSGLRYWVKDSVTAESIIVAECHWLLHLVPVYKSRVPTEVRLAFEALTTPELMNRALVHSLSNYLKYIDLRAIQGLQTQGQALQTKGRSLQGSFSPPMTVQQPAVQLIQTAVLTWTGHVTIPQGPRTSGIRPGGFFPRAASSWRALWKRFDAGGWSLSMLRMLIFYQRQLVTADLRAHTFGSMKKHRKDAQNHQCSAASFTLENISTDCVSSNIDFNDLRDCFLFSLGDGLVHFPQGADEGILTIAVRYARYHGHNNVRLSQVEQYITQERLDLRYNLPGPSPVSVVQADQAARDRHYPDHNSNPARRQDPNYDLIKRWWRAGGYFHDV
ncbi:hypothetical protein G6011_00292 [Alternaria panax]|uniref:Uncharacterized protein n=1 Tax=Alternaria panax TaxID=48097 RepID=A0AAD4NUL0_9PLEO|nr:hypothetical protein G6011_00292 [Alternaria panax]